MVSAKGAYTLLAKRYLGPFWLRRRWLKKTERFSPAEMEELQLILLKKLIHRCYRTIPYYQTVMETHNITPDKIRSLDDVKLFPVLTKKDILEAGTSLLPTTYPNWMLRKAYTGGTTGTPMLLYRSLSSISTEHAFVRRQWDWAGLGLRDKCGYLTGRIIVPPNQTNGTLYKYDPFMKELILSTYHLSPDTARGYAEALKQYQVKAIVGYPSAVYLLARTCLDAGVDISLRSALTSSETLTPSMRRTIAEAFQCRVYDFYGSAERVCYIFTCSEGRYHIIPEYGLTELIPVDDSDPKRCKVVSTGFWNPAMPFIRYALEDTVIKSEESCPCGRAFPVVESIVGRKGDVITTPSGREFGAAILTHLLYGTDHILESQIIQDAPDHITITYVPGENFSSQDLGAFQGLIKQHLPDELKVDLEPVQAVQRTSSGKIRPVVSQIN